MFCWLKDLWECILKVKKVFVEITYFKFLSYILFKYQNLFTYILEEFFWCNSINSLTQPFSATFLYFIEELLLSNIQGKKILKTRVKKSKVTQIHTQVSKYLNTGFPRTTRIRITRIRITRFCKRFQFLAQRDLVSLNAFVLFRNQN